MRFLLVCLLLMVFLGSQAQITNTATMDTLESIARGHIALGGYIDSYYGYDFSQPKSGDMPYFVTSARHNEFNINLAYVDLRYRSKNLRVRIVPGFGTYMNANYADEPGTLKNFVEASVGVRIFSKRNIWLDVGILGSPYTNESAISKDHLMYTRSFGTQFAPYYLSGAKLSVPVGKKINLFFYLLNGWQVIRDNNSGKAVATQVEYRPNAKMLFNWNTYLGSEQSSKNPNFRTRYFSEVFWIVKASDKFDATACAYIGVQDVANAPSKLWESVSLIGRYHFTEKISLSGRVEYFNDPGSVQQIPITGVNGFSTGSSGLCLNVKIDNSALFRIEGRQFFAPDRIYQDANLSPVQSNTLLAASLTAWF